MEVLSYKCPNCTAPLKYSSETGKWDCDSCDSSFDLETLKQYEEMLKPKEAEAKDNWSEYNAESGNGDWSEEESSHLVVYNCPSCGAEIIADENTAATECYYCHNQAIIPKKLEGTFKPDFIIPFKKSKDDATAAYHKHISGKILLPKDFKDNNRIEKMTGVYVPFWLYDAETDADINYRATRVMSWREGKYQVTKTDHYLIKREGGAGFEKVPVDGSKKIDDTLMESIEPFDYSALVPFTMAYLSGFLADKYDVDAHANLPRVDERVKSSTEQLIRDTVTGYSTVSVMNETINVKDGAIIYALLPVWLMYTKYEGKDYTFAMNAQTGKFIGDLPYSKGRFLALLFGIMIIGTVVVCLIIFILLSMGVIY